ncbi:MAG: dTMP kinase [Steroidobacteraceae bacterium]|nr:dTMP kinase [Steroidobacteraceae bacterium]
MAGRFITLEGIEGAGKSTAARFVREWLSARGLTVCLTREPGGTPLAERVRQLVLDRQGEAITPVTETLLMFAARGLHVQNLIRPALARGEWVVCDRFTDATRAYQGAGRGVSLALIDQLASAVQEGLQPDCTLLLDLPVAAGLERVRMRSGSVPSDRFEEEPAQFFERVRAAYLDIARAAPARVRIIDASRPLEAVQEQIARALEALCSGTA